MRPLSFCLLFCVGVGFSTSAWVQPAKTYKCVDAKGKTLYSADPSRDCKGGPTEIKGPPPGTGKAPTASATPTPANPQGPVRTPAEQDKWDAGETERRALQKNPPR